MKKNDFIIMLICLAFMFASQVFAPNKAFSQEGKEWFKTVIKVEDAKGNIDSVIFYVKEGATKGIDSHLGEVNLYGTEPKGDLDIRIIQRKKESEYWFEYYEPSASEDIDLKIDYRFDSTFHNGNSSCPSSYVIKVNAKHYPVSIFLTETTLFTYVFDLEQFKEKDGSYVVGGENSIYSFYGSFPYLLYTFNDSLENNLLRFSQQMLVSIEEIINQPLLYPNPSKEYIVIKDGKYGEKFEIINSEGKLIQSFVVETYPYHLDTSSLPLGSYILKNADGTIINKFIKE